jgi:hypothetical protein
MCTPAQRDTVIKDALLSTPSHERGERRIFPTLGKAMKLRKLMQGFFDAGR